MSATKWTHRTPYTAQKRQDAGAKWQWLVCDLQKEVERTISQEGEKEWTDCSQFPYRDLGWRGPLSLQGDRVGELVQYEEEVDT